MTKQIACVTGAFGMVGGQIVNRLLAQGYKVRALSRVQHRDRTNVELFHGGLSDEDVLKSFLSNAHLLFHCAAELNDESKMWDVNVLGTERLLHIARESSIHFLCYMSSAGVVGRTTVKWVDEKCKCEPQNIYEKSKCAAEKLVAKGIDGCRTVILRPTNVVDAKRPGTISLPVHGLFLSRLKVFLKGGECSHIVHAEDVAEAAIYFISHNTINSQCYFVSCDHEPLNTFAGVWALYKAVEKKRPVDKIKPVLHIPLIIPYIMRNLWRGVSNRGDVRYASEKLMSEGFNFPLGLKGAIKEIAAIYGGEQE